MFGAEEVIGIFSGRIKERVNWTVFLSGLG
jgi:hypothetical protein